MATRKKDDFQGMANDPDAWIVIPEFDVLPANVNGRGFDRFVFVPEIDRSIQGPIWNIIGSMRTMAKKRFSSLAELSAVTDRVLASRKPAEKGTDDEWFAYGYSNVFDLLERWHHTYPFNMLEASVMLARIADDVLAMFTGGPHDPKSIAELRSQFARKGAVTKLANSPKQKEKQQVRECWDDWQKDPNRYKSKEEFADDMRLKYLNLKSQRVITRWCLEWEREVD